MSIDRSMRGTLVDEPCGHPRIDWRGWIAVGWVVFWGAAYAITVVQARAPWVLEWMRSLSPGR